MNKYLLTLLFAFTGILITKADIEPNDTQGQAESLTLGTTVSGTVSSPDLNDWYKFTTTADGELVVSVDLSINTGTNAQATVYDKNGNTLTSNNGPGVLSLSVMCRQPGDYFVRIVYSTGDGSYTINANSNPNAITDIGEPNNSATQAFLLSENTLSDGHLGYVDADNGIDNQDWYEIRTTEDGDLRIATFVVNPLAAYITLFDKFGNSLVSTATGSDSLIINYRCVNPDTFHVRVFHNTACESYNIKWNLNPNNVINDIEPNGIITKAIDFKRDSLFTGHLGYRDASLGTDNQDWYELISSGDGNLHVTAVVDSPLTAFITLFDRLGNALLSSATGSDTLSITRNCIEPDTFRVRIFHNSNCGSYTLKWNYDSLNAINDTESNNNVNEATTFEADSVYKGHLGYMNVSQGTDIQDWYELITTGDGNLHVTAIVDSPLTAYITLFDRLGNALLSSATGSDTLSITRNCIEPDTFRVRIFHNGNCGSYALKWDFDSTLAANDTEPNNNGIQSNFIFIDSVYSGHLGYWDASLGIDNQDWYNATLDSGKIAIVCNLDSALSGYITLFDTLGNALSSSPTKTGLIILKYNLNYKGTHRIRLFHNANCGAYNIRVVPEPKANFSISKNISCIGDTVMFKDSSMFAEKWEWSFENGDITADTIPNPKVNYSQKGQFDVRLVVSNPAGTDTLVKGNYAVISEPIADAGTDHFICPGDSVLLGTPLISGMNYLWNSDSTLNDSTLAEPFASPTTSTQYILTVTDATLGCTNADTVNVTVLPVSTLSGLATFKNNGDTVRIGGIFLIQHDSLALVSGRFPKIDSVLIRPDGTYRFKNVPPGRYTLLARPRIKTYAKSIPTYLGNTRFWRQAATLDITCNNNEVQNIEILRLPKTPPTGQGRLTGVIFYDDNYNKPRKPKKTAWEDETEGTPVSDVDIILEKIPGTILAITETDSSGRYTFNNVPFEDSLQIYVEIPGMDMDTANYQIELTLNDSTEEDLNFFVDSIIHPGSDPTNIISLPLIGDAGFVKIYPNPYREHTTIELSVEKKSTIRLEIYSTLGEKFVMLNQQAHTEGVYKTRFSAADYGAKPGIYFLRVTVDNNVSTLRFIELD